MNKPLFRKIIKAIRDEPRRFNMGNWIITDDREAPCGTTACIAGFAVILSKPKYQWKKTAASLLSRYRKSEKFLFEVEAAKLLRISESQADDLFFVSGWPDRFARRFNNARNREAEAKVVIARIEHFMKSGK